MRSHPITDETYAGKVHGWLCDADVYLRGEASVHHVEGGNASLDGMKRLGNEMQSSTPFQKPYDSSRPSESYVSLEHRFFYRDPVWVLVRETMERCIGAETLVQEVRTTQEAGQHLIARARAYEKFEKLNRLRGETMKQFAELGVQLSAEFPEHGDRLGSFLYIFGMEESELEGQVTKVLVSALCAALEKYIVGPPIVVPSAQEPSPF